MASRTKIFSKKLTKTDISKRMSIPTNQLGHLANFEGGHHAKGVTVEDEIGHMWTMRCSIRKQKYPKPVMSTGWITFARNNNLGIGDKVTFYKVLDVESSGTKYKIKVKKAKKVFGAIIGYTPARSASI